MAARTRRDDHASARFVERFAGDLIDAGMPGMPARVFAALLASEDGSLTATQLAEVLHSSPASISNAVRYLMQVSMIRREREPGSRRQRYRVDDNAWYEGLLQREQLLARWIATLDQGLGAVGPATPAGHRLGESRDFLVYLADEMPKLLARWRADRST